MDFGSPERGPGGGSIPDSEKVLGELAWVCHPARHRPVAAAFATLLLVLLWIGVWFWLEDPVLTAASVVLLSASLSPVYLPTWYRMTEDTISIRTIFGQRKKAWDLYRRHQADRHGVLLSPFDHPSRLDRFHGLNLRFDAGDRMRVLEFVEARLRRE